MRHTLLTLAAAIVAPVSGCGDSHSDKTPPAPVYVAGKFDPNDREFKKQVEARLAEQKKEESIREEASWFGNTGLAEDAERELPRYLRRELGHLLSQPGSLKAKDLVYLGAFTEGAETVRYWQINYGSPKPKFAYIVSGPNDRQFTGWGNRTPPK